VVGWALVCSTSRAQPTEQQFYADLDGSRKQVIAPKLGKETAPISNLELEATANALAEKYGAKAMPWLVEKFISSWDKTTPPPRLSLELLTIARLCKDPAALTVYERLLDHKHYGPLALRYASYLPPAEAKPVMERYLKSHSKGHEDFFAALQLLGAIGDEDTLKVLAAVRLGLRNDFLEEPKGKALDWFGAQIKSRPSVAEIKKRAEQTELELRYLHTLDHRYGYLSDEYSIRMRAAVLKFHRIEFPAQFLREKAKTPQFEFWRTDQSALAVVLLSDLHLEADIPLFLSLRAKPDSVLGRLVGDALASFPKETVDKY
jgi:hypothetical protein